jgi:hypothetical protein
MKKPVQLHAIKLVAFLFVASIAGGCTDLPTGPAGVPAMSVRGVTLADWTADGYGRTSAVTAVDHIADLGASRVVIVVTAYQSRATDSTVRTDPTRTPTEAAVEQSASRAVALGLEVCVKLHVDVDTGDWRGSIRPADPSAWFSSYASFVDRWAEFAGRVGAAQLVVGTELAGTIEHEGRWRALLESVRSRYGGEIVYAASWDEAWKVPFWDAVDRVGVDFYAPVAGRRDAGRVEILAGWQPWMERLVLLHRQTGKRLLLTEIGYRSIDGAGMHPYDFGAGAVADPAEQADLYWAALEAVGDKEWIEGVYWWNWLASGRGGIENLDYTPMGKPAEEELTGAWRG